MAAAGRPATAAAGGRFFAVSAACAGSPRSLYLRPAFSRPQQYGRRDAQVQRHRNGFHVRSTISDVLRHRQCDCRRPSPIGRRRLHRAHVRWPKGAMTLIDTARAPNALLRWRWASGGRSSFRAASGGNNHRRRVRASAGRAGLCSARSATIRLGRHLSLATDIRAAGRAFRDAERHHPDARPRRSMILRDNRMPSGR